MQRHNVMSTEYPAGSILLNCAMCCPTQLISFGFSAIWNTGLSQGILQARWVLIMETWTHQRTTRVDFMKKKLCNATMWCPQNTLLAAFFLIVQCVVLLNWFLLDFLAILKHGSFAGHFAILIAITIELDVLWLWRRGYISALLVLTLLIKNYATWQCVVHKTSSIYSIVQHVVLLNR